MAHFNSSFLGILHNFSVVAGIAANCHDPLSVSQVCSLKEELVLIYTEVFTFDIHCSVESVKLSVRKLNLYLTCCCFEFRRIFFLSWKVNI